MSDAASLPETLEGTIVHNSRTSHDNWPTVTRRGNYFAPQRALSDTRRGNYIAPQRALLDKIDTVQETIDSIKTALMQTYSPVSTNAGNNARAKLESTRFVLDKATINQQIIDFHVNVSVLESAMDYKLEPLELWTFVTSSIKGAGWTSFRQTMSMQREYKEHQSFWFIDQIREYILDFDRKKTNNDLREVITTLTANINAITTKMQNSNFVMNAGAERPYDLKMGPCRYCGEGHRHRDCHTLKTLSSKAQKPPSTKEVNDDGPPGILMGAVAVDQPTRSSKTTFPILARSTTTSTFYNRFGVDSCASEHICHDKDMFSTLDSTKSRTFSVVHGETITSSGVGDVELLVETTQGKPKVLTLRNVHYIPEQSMSLISVDKIISGQDFDSPDFKNLTWKADDTCTLKILATNGTFELDASVRYWSWTNGVHKQH